MHVLLCVMHVCVMQQVRAAEKKKKAVAKVLADADLLSQAKIILRDHQHQRQVCKKKLLVTHYRVLLMDLGLEKAIRKVVDGKTVHAKHCIHCTIRVM